MARFTRSSPNLDLASIYPRRSTSMDMNITQAGSASDAAAVAQSVVAMYGGGSTMPAPSTDLEVFHLNAPASPGSMAPGGE